MPQVFVLMAVSVCIIRLSPKSDTWQRCATWVKAGMTCALSQSMCNETKQRIWPVPWESRASGPTADCIMVSVSRCSQALCTHTLAENVRGSPCAASTSKMLLQFRSPASTQPCEVGTTSEVLYFANCLDLCSKGIPNLVHLSVLELVYWHQHACIPAICRNVFSSYSALLVTRLCGLSALRTVQHVL